jgi:hypothetical protein
VLPTLQKFDIATLAAAYDRGRLAPFIGSGMSSPACSSWSGMITQLERQAGIENQSNSRGLIQRALFALQLIRQRGVDVAGAISQSIYLGDAETAPPQTTALASIFWPLVCTTNYDDIYLRAKLQIELAKLQAAGAKLQKATLPRVLGRSEADCREVLEHLSFPTREVIWALQGLLPPRELDVKPPGFDVKNALGKTFEREQFERELVVGHAEYRREAHRAVHFHRSFAELFRTRSLFFLGSGLGEPYFLSLFDEIIELTGPPAQPHFALVQEGKVDTDFLQRQYHILCNTYPQHQHQCVAEFLSEFSAYTSAQRVRPGRWGFRLMSPRQLNRDHGGADHFTCVRGVLPDVEGLPKGDAVAISCGRDGPGRGYPLASRAGLRMLGLSKLCPSWQTDYIVSCKTLSRAYGIVAREIDDDSRSSRDRRSPEAIRVAFQNFLNHVHEKQIQRIHVQLLAAGESRVFQPWVSLSQMTRAYGEWFRSMPSADLRDLTRVVVYVVDPGVIALLQGGYLDLAQQLQGAPMRVIVEVIDAFGRTERHYQIVSADARLAELVAKHPSRDPQVSARPAPRLNPEAKPLSNVIDLRAREFGLLSGSALVVDYRISSTKH